MNTTGMLIIIAGSIMLFANNLKSINGNGDLFPMTTNRKLKTSAATEIPYTKRQMANYGHF